MRISRYIIAGILIVAAFFIMGEFNIWNSEIFEGNYYSTSMYLQSNQKPEDMKKDIETTAEEHSVVVFAIKNEYENAYKTILNIYGTQGAKEIISKKSQVKEGSFEGILLGEKQVEFHDFAEMPDIDNQHDFFLIGSESDMDAFKAELINDYAGNFPQEPIYPTSELSIVIGLWAGIFLLILLMTAFNVTSVKKEYSLRRIMGDDMRLAVGTNIAMDFAAFTLIFLITRTVMKYITKASFYENVPLYIFLGFIVINSMLYLLLLRFNYKKDLGTKGNEKAVLNVSYSYKLVITVISVIVMAYFLALINSGIELYSQKDFFEELKDDYYVGLRGEDSDASDAVSQEIYEEYTQKDDSFQLADIGGFSESESNVVVNKGAISYLESCIPELKGKTDEKVMYYIVPKGYSQQAVDDLPNLLNRFTEEKIDFKVLEYEKKAKIIALRCKIDMEYISEYVKNPYIIFNNSDINLQDIYMNNGTVYHMSQEEAESLNKRDDLVLTNAYSQYLRNWQKEKKGLTAGFVFFALLMLIECMIVRTIIRYEYRVNATKMILKKIHGESIYSRYRRIVNLTIGSFLVAMAASILVGMLYFKSSVPYMITGILILLAVELFYIFRYSIGFEKSSIQKILKGGTL